MGKIPRRVMTRALKVFDLALMVVSFGVATLPVLARVGPISFAQFLSLRIKLENCIVFVFLLWTWHFIFAMLGMYDSKRLESRRSEAIDVIKATSLASLVLLLSSSLLHFQMVKRGFVVIFWMFSSCLLAVSRLALRIWLRRLRVRGHNSRNMLIVGSNRRAIEFAETVRSKPELGYRIMGFADEEWPGLQELINSGWARVCDFGSLRNFVRRNVVDELVLALPFRSFHTHASDIAVMCEKQGIIVRALSDLFNLKTARSIGEDLEGAALIMHSAGPADGWPAVMKRALDVVLSLLLLAVFLPLLLATAVFIKLSSLGPVLFKQKRVGLNKRTFSIYKFRTMVVNAEKRLVEIEHMNEASGPVFKIKNDPRLTRIGKLLRKTSIDELPQLFNVLKGDMSLVGPRPLQLRDYDLFTEDGEDWQRCRFSVRPGITCLWQVNGRSSVPFDRWMELDLQYIRNWSFWLDLQILAKTIPAVLRGSGAT